MNSTEADNDRNRSHEGEREPKDVDRMRQSQKAERVMTDYTAPNEDDKAQAHADLALVAAHLYHHGEGLAVVAPMRPNGSRVSGERKRFRCTRLLGAPGLRTGD